MKTKTYSILMVASFLSMGMLCGCSSFSRVSAEKFMYTARRGQEPQVNTIVDIIEVIGCTSDRAYLEYRPAITFIGPRVRVYWTPLSEFPAGVREDIKKGQYPRPRPIKDYGIDWKRLQPIPERE